MALRESIVDAALAVVAERGLDGASYDVIAARAGASKGAVQHHFPAKGALALALVERVAAGLRAKATERSAHNRGEGVRDWRALVRSVAASTSTSVEGQALAALRVGARGEASHAAALARAEDELRASLTAWIAAQIAARSLTPRVAPERLAALVLVCLERGDERAVEALCELLPAAVSV